MKSGTLIKNAEQGQSLSDARRHGDALQTQLNSATRVNAEQDIQLFNAFLASQAADVKLEEAAKTITRQAKIISKTTKDLIDINSELEKTHLQNLQFRQAMEQDPGKTADMDNALALLKRELGETEDRAIQAEEDFIQLQKRTNHVCLQKDAEMTALTAENGVLHTALDEALESNETLRTTMQSCLMHLQGGIDDDGLRVALQMYCSVVGQDNQLHAKIREMTQMHSHAVQKNKDLQLRCVKLENSARDTQNKVTDLETALREKSDKVDILEIEANAKQRGHETSLTQRDQAVTSFKNEADQCKDMLKVMRNAGADACISWWFKYQEVKVEHAVTALQTSENRVKDLEQKLSATEKQCTNLYTHDYSEYPEMLADARDEIQNLRNQVVLFEQQGGSIQYIQKLADSQDEIKDLQKRLEESDCKYASKDYVKWADHMSRVNEVQARTKSLTESLMRQDLEEQLKRAVSDRWGSEYVVPLVDLGRHFWARIGRLERTLSHYGINADDNEREALLKASVFMQIDTSGGVPVRQGPWR